MTAQQAFTNYLFSWQFLLLVAGAVALLVALVVILALTFNRR